MTPFRAEAPVRGNDVFRQLRFNDEVGLNLIGFGRAAKTYRGSPRDFQFWELIYLTRGGAELHYDGQVHVVEAGQYMLLAPFANHLLHADGFQDFGILYVHFSFTFDPARSVHTDLQLPLIDPPLSDQVAGRFREIAEEIDAADTPDLAAYRRPMHEIILELVHQITTPTPDGAPHDGFAHRVKQFLEHNGHGPVSLDQVARAFYLSPSHLSRKFKEATGQTIKQYHHQIRMHRAADLLVKTDRSVTEIAGDLGFDTIHHFSRRFKAYFKRSPVEYRAHAPRETPTDN